MHPTVAAAYIALFSSVGVLFVFVNLLIGRFVRPSVPDAEKGEAYECGEPAIGSAFVQFDLRFYVVALLFIIFDVEVAFFFPWGVVFGQSTELMDPNGAALVSVVEGGGVELTSTAAAGFAKLGMRDSAAVLGDATAGAEGMLRQASRMLAFGSLTDILVFFAVLMVGFAYVWRRGDLDWVRAVSKQRAAATPRPAAAVMRKPEPVLS